MGASIACQIFERFSAALEFAAVQKGVELCTHYLDDFLFVNPQFQGCNKDLDIFIKTCNIGKVP